MSVADTFIHVHLGFLTVQARLRGFLLFCAVALFVVLTVLAIVQPLRPDPYQGGEFLSLSWWLHPYERNANNRLDAIRANLNAIYALPDASRVWVVGNQGLLAFSDNWGGTWNRQTVQTAETIRTEDFAFVIFADVQRGGAGDFRTKDGGTTWLEMAPRSGLGGFSLEWVTDAGVSVMGSDNFISLCFTQDGSSWQVLNGTGHVRPTGILRSDKLVLSEQELTDFEFTFFNFTNEALYSVFFTSAKSGWVAGAHGTVFKTTDIGNTWRTQKTESDQIIRALFFLPDGKRGWAGGEHGALQYTEDGGETWAGQATNTNTTLRAIFFLKDGLRGWTAGTSGVILHTDDGGMHWIHQTRELNLDAAVDQSKPWRFLPPWYFFSLLLPGWLGYLALRPQRSDAIEEETIADLFISDRPLEPGDADPMNFHAVAIGLSRFLRNEKTLPPLTIAITGEWGTGKSSLMNLLRADLRKYGFQPVWFNAWHHQKEEHLLASLLQNIRLQAIPPWWRSEGLIFRSRLLAIRGWRRWLPLLLLFTVIAIVLGYAVTQPLPELSELSSGLDRLVHPGEGQWLAWLEITLKVGSVLTLAGTVVAGLRKGLTSFGVKPASLMSSGSGKLSVNDLEAQTSFRQKFAVQFLDVTKALNPRTMIIFVDDLDRCRPENMLEVLEAINFLVSSGDCFVVMGMARDRVERCVGLGFKDVAEEMVDDNPVAQPEISELNKGRTKRSDFAKQYLDKLINIEVPVPAPTADEFRQLLMPGSPLEQKSFHRVTSIAVFAKKLWPLLVISSFLLIGFWIGKNLHQSQPQAPLTPPLATAQTATGTGSTSGSQSDVPPTKVEEPKGTPSSSAQELAEFHPSQRPSKAPEFYILALILLLVIGGASWFLARPLDLIVRDSPGFVKALDIWHPVIVAKRKTPRSLKRFTNRVRYLAMRQRPPQESHSLLQRLETAIRRRLGREEPTRPATLNMPLIPESSLVALCVLDSVSPNLVMSEKLWGLITNLQESTNPLNFDLDVFQEWERSTDVGRVELNKAMDGHVKQFGSWPTDAQRRIYLTITAGLRVN